MNIQQILALKPKKMSYEDKVKAISKLVKEARKEFGNSEDVIEAPSVNSTTGLKPLKYCSDEDKCALAEIAMANIDTTAIEASGCVSAVVAGLEDQAYVAKRLELIATNPVLCNLSVKSAVSKY